MLCWGGTPAKLFFDNQASSAEIVGAIVKAGTIIGETRQIAPTVERPDIRTAEGILGAIGWKSIKENYIKPLVSGNEWKFLHITVDSASANYKMIRTIVADCAEFPRLIVSFTPCFAHVLSLMVKWAIGRHFEYGSILRV